MSTMTDQMDTGVPETVLPEINTVYPILPSILRKFDRFARRDRFCGQTPDEFAEWKDRMRILLRDLLGLEKMETCPLSPRQLSEEEILPGGILRKHLAIQVEPEVWMPFYLLIPEQADRNTVPFLCPPGHGGAGKYTVAGAGNYVAIREKIKYYQYDYGMQLAKLGYVALCPDCRGFGERRELLSDTGILPEALKGDCYYLAHMGEPLGIPVAGMLVWDLMRAADYLQEYGEWDFARLSCLGFSGGGMQTMFFSALDDRVHLAVISGYLYGYRNSLLTQNRNCSCNYIPHLWEHLDMGDIASLIAPKFLWVQSCREDRQNGPQGIENVLSQTAILRSTYERLQIPERFFHEICEGPHSWHGEHLKENLERFL